MFHRFQLSGQNSVFRTARRSAHRCGRRRQQLERLEERALLTAYVVDTLADDPAALASDTDGFISLREALQAASSNQPFGDAPAGQGGGVVDTISFHPSLAGHTIVLSGEELVIGDDVTITGLGADQLTISGGGTSRLFSLTEGISARIEQLTMTAGSADEGGALHSSGELTVADSILVDNFAEYSGGAIWNSGQLIIDRCSLVNNSVTFEESGFDFNGGAIYNEGGSLVIKNHSTISHNRSRSQGGAIWNNGQMEIEDSLFEDNQTLGNGGAIANRAPGTLNVRAGSFLENRTNGSGGAINNFGAVLDVQHSVFQGNSANGFGAAIFTFQSSIVGTPQSADVSHSVFTENRARGGGAISAWGSLNLSNSTLSNNEAVFDGGALEIVGATVRISNSTISGNRALREGGALWNWFSNVTVVNSTISGNRTHGDGGAIWNEESRLTVTHGTITDNHANWNGVGTGSGGALYHLSSAKLPDPIINNSIVAGNRSGLSEASEPDDISGALDPSSAHNLIGDAATAGGLIHGLQGNIVGNGGSGTLDVATVLDLNLTDNGGPTRTHALLIGSPAIDVGDNSLAIDGDGNQLHTDQRGSGFLRISGGTVDLGAFEFVQPLVIEINIRPEVLNLASNGVIAVAILTTSQFDASQVDVSTVIFAGAFAVRSSLEDVNGDGQADLVLHFRVQDTNLADIYARMLMDDVEADGFLDSTRQTYRATLSGQTTNGQSFAGNDELDLFFAGKALRDLLDQLFG